MDSPRRHIEFLHWFPLRGPSQWTYRPVLELWVDIGELEESPSNTIPGFVDRLCEWLPTLSEHRCSYGEPGGFVKRLEEGTWPAHILEHITLELQNLAGMPGGYGRARETHERGVYKVVVSAPDEEFTRESLLAGRELVLAAMDGRPFDVPGTVRRLRELAELHRLDPSGACLAAAASERGRLIPVNRIGSSSLVILGLGANQRRIWASRTDATGAIADGIACDFDLCQGLLKNCGLPVLSRAAVDSEASAWSEAQDFGLPAVVKPATGAPGDPGLMVRTETEAAAAYREAAGADGTGRVVVEKALPGPRYRLLVTNGQMLAATTHEAGDFSDESPNLLAEIHPSTAEAVCLAARVVGLDLAGIEVALAAPDCVWSADTAVILGVHASPVLMSQAPAIDAPPSRVGRSIVNALFPGGGDGRIPVVGIAGSHGSAAVARKVAEFSRLSGKQTGLACADGLFLNRRQVETNDCANWHSGRRVLLNRWVETAVLENGGGQILGEGLPYDRCQVGVVTGIDPEAHLGPFYIDTPERVYNIFRTQVDVVLPTGVAVLNAGDPMVAPMADLCDGEVIFFAANPAAAPPLAAHREKGGRAVIVRDGSLVLTSDGEDIEIGPLSGIPFLADENDNAGLTSVLASVGAAWALGIAIDVIRTGLETFMKDAPDLRVMVPRDGV